MSVGFIGISPTPLNGSGNFWATSATANQTQLGINNAKVPKFKAGTTFSFKQYETWYAAFRYARITNASIGDIAINRDSYWGASTGYSIFEPIIDGGYTDAGDELSHNGTVNPPNWIFDDLNHRLEGFDFGGIYNSADYTPAGVGASNGTWFDVNYNTGYANSSSPRNGITVLDGGSLNYYINGVFVDSDTLVDTDTFFTRVTPTAFEFYKNGVLQESSARTVTTTTSGGTLGNVGANPANITNTVNTTGLAAGLYTLSSTFSDGQVETVDFEISPTPTLDNLPVNGYCWQSGETLDFIVSSGTITAIASQTVGVSGTTSGLGTASASFTLNYTNNNTLTTSTIRVTTNEGLVHDFIVNICLMLPPITNTIDDPNVTTDDAANLPPSSIYQCVGVAVDVRGAGYTTTDITWSVLTSGNVPVVSGVTITGQNTIQATIALDDTVAPGNYKFKAVETATPANVSEHSFTLLALPPVTVSAPNQPHVGGTTQFVTSFPFPLAWSPAEVNASTGLATWATAGVKTVTYTPTSSACTESISFTVYDLIEVAEYDEVNCVYLNSGDSIPLTVTGGSGTYVFSITGQNTITDIGVVTAGMYAGEYVVTIVDDTAGIVKNIPICIGTQSQFCVTMESSSCEQELADSCCELSLDCGESVTLKIPSFHMRINGREEEVAYTAFGSGTVGASGYLKAGATVTDAKANMVDCTKDEALFEIVTNLDMADTVNGAFGIGFSKQDSAPGVAGIDIGVVWHTTTGVRYIQVRKNGVAVVGSTKAILQGDVVSAGFKAGKFVVYVNNLLEFETTDFDCCGEQFMDIAIEQANKSIGGFITGLTWTITTAGTPSEVGSIDANGVYTSPSGSSFGLVSAEATVGNATFRVNIRNIKPSEKYTKPQAFLAGKAVSLWVGPYIPNLNESIRLAKDGTPDANQNPGMIDCGTLEGSANFQEQMEYQDFEDDLGRIYHTSITKEAAQITATFLEVRDLYKMSIFKPEATLYSKKNGVTEFAVGGKGCDTKDLRVIMVIGTPGCDDTYDVLYLPRVQNKGNLGMEVGRKTNAKYELTLTALPDYTRTTGKQLYSIYQIDNCSSVSCN